MTAAQYANRLAEIGNTLSSLRSERRKFPPRSKTITARELDKQIQAVEGDKHFAEQDWQRRCDRAERHAKIVYRLIADHPRQMPIDRIIQSLLKTPEYIDFDDLSFWLKEHPDCGVDWTELIEAGQKYLDSRPNANKPFDDKDVIDHWAMRHGRFPLDAGEVERLKDLIHDARMNDSVNY